MWCLEARLDQREDGCGGTSKRRKHNTPVANAAGSLDRF
jgi:hypothetical protein